MQDIVRFGGITSQHQTVPHVNTFKMLPLPDDTLKLHKE